MTFLKQLPAGQRKMIQDLLNQDLGEYQKMLELTKRMQKNIRYNIQFYRDVLRNRQTLENLDLRLKLAREKRKMEVER